MNWLQWTKEAQHVPIVVVTGGEPTEYEARALAAGAVSVFHKPIDNDALLSVIRETPGENATEPAPSVAPAPPVDRLT